MTLYVQTNVIEYGIITYVYDKHIDPISSAHAFQEIEKIIKLLSPYTNCTNLTIYIYQKRKKYITCKIISSDKTHESTFKTTLDKFPNEVAIIANSILNDWFKVTKLGRSHYFEVK